jgi:uncharacterized protein (DUF952 family)
MGTRIYHLIDREAWTAFRKAGTYSPPSLEAEGFIHCSTADRVVEVAQAFYKGRTNLVLLEVDPDRLTSKLAYEPAADRPGVFPHVYGPLSLQEVVGVDDFPLGEDGRFHWEAP